MSSADAENALLIRTSAEFVDLFARFVSDCGLADNSEPHLVTPPHSQDVRPSEHSTVHNQWRYALKHVSRLTAYTRSGARAKIRVLRCCLEHGLASDEDVIILVNSLALDLDKLLHDDSDCACQLLFSESSAGFGTN